MPRSLPKARAQARGQLGDGGYVDVRPGHGVALDGEAGGDARGDESSDVLVTQRQAKGGRQPNAPEHARSVVEKKAWSSARAQG